MIEFLAGSGILQEQNIFMLSGVNIPEIELKNLLRRDGINGFLKKPIEPERILTAISN